MAGKFDLESYETVETRLARFWEKYPEGRVLTQIVHQDERRFILRAEIYFDRKDQIPVATGFAEEIVGASPVNRTSALENGETSAIGRALANCNFASQGKRPSREEMEKVERYKAEPRKPVATKAPVTFTDEQIKTATTVADALNQTTEIELLREWYSANSAILEAPVYGSTLKDLFNKRVEELKA